MKQIVCYDCDGKRWVIVYGWHGLPEQEKCQCCNGVGTITVSDEFAEMYQKGR